jgi:hypothetical protein
LDESRHTSGRIRLRLLLAVAVVTIAAMTWGVSQIQSNAADRAFAASRAGQQMLTAMLDKQTGLRGFTLTREEEYLTSFVRGERNFDAAAESARRNVDRSGRVALDEQVAAARRWRVLAGYELTRLRASNRAPLDLPAVRVRKDVFDRYRRANGSFQAQVGAERRSDPSRTSTPEARPCPGQSPGTGRVQRDDADHA